MLYLFGALMLVGRIRSSWRNFVKNWQSWDWKRLKPTSTVAIFSLLRQTPKPRLVEELETFFAVNYPFIQSFSLLSQEDYEEELENLPDWWTKGLARKDVLFYTESLDVDQVIEKVNSLELEDEVVHFGRLGTFLGKILRRIILRNSLSQILTQDAFLPPNHHS